MQCSKGGDVHAADLPFRVDPAALVRFSITTRAPTATDVAGMVVLMLTRAAADGVAELM